MEMWLVDNVVQNDFTSRATKFGEDDSSASTRREIG